MIARYSRPEMAAVWAEENRFGTMLRIEQLACAAMAELGIIPLECAEAIARLKPQDVSPGEIAEIELKTRHETVAFLECVERQIGAEKARFLHWGMTSSDVLDTCFSLQLKSASDILLSELNQLSSALKERAFEYKHTLCVGRTHGIHAQPITFGLKLASAYAEVRRGHHRLSRAKEEISVGMVSGPVGTYSGLGPAVEQAVCAELGLRSETVSTQIVPRDRHAYFFSVLAGIASTIERIATELRHLQRTEVGEVEELFGKQQTGSSAMPHKRNPILSENVCGLARLVRSAAMPAFENVALWHERDMSHSSVERIIAPNTTQLLDFALNRMTGIIRCMRVSSERMADNAQMTAGACLSNRVLSDLVAQGAVRSEAHSLVKTIAERAIEEKITFQDALSSDITIAKFLSREHLQRIFDQKHSLTHVDTIFERVFST